MKTQEAADFFGSRVKLAKVLGITPSSITGWGDCPPIARQCQIQVISGGRLIADVGELPADISADHAQMMPTDCRSGQTANPAGQASSVEASA